MPATVKVSIRYYAGRIAEQLTEPQRGHLMVSIRYYAGRIAELGKTATSANPA